ncbi:TetR/AcrR family transcriptional regulator [Antrihabitans sp. NCIMB 15449]|uniref:TetR/AcrR family transcriptional regulator n=1 Tax=Antrihabitans spumae TaxID=3373370 RepID=A0ABW7JTF4_9NOCA
MVSQPAVRSTYRHGDLRRALVTAGLDLAREGGPDAVVLREATRRAGVSPNAAYRHFADHRALLAAVSAAAMAELANAIESDLSLVGADLDAATRARAQLGAVGSGYLAYAQAEPGLFRTAFSVPDDMSTKDSTDAAGPRGRTPFELLSDALDELVTAGVLPHERRSGAEYLAWSAVHGLAMLLIDGPLRGLDLPDRNEVTWRLLAMVDKGL